MYIYLKKTKKNDAARDDRRHNTIERGRQNITATVFTCTVYSQQRERQQQEKTKEQKNTRRQQHTSHQFGVTVLLVCKIVLCLTESNC